MAGASRHHGMRYRFLGSVYACYVPLALGLGLWARQQGALPWRWWPLGIVLGVLCWTLIEYVLHRFVLHLHLQAATVQHAIERLHLGHHRDPHDEAKVTVPVYGSLPIAAALMGIFRLMAGGWEAAAALMIGSIAGYLWYETVHFRLHCSTRCGRWWRWQRANHFFHHFREQRRCFGVTTPLWDWVCGTGRRRLASHTLHASRLGRQGMRRGMA